jgi:hypothetical protein
MAVLMPPTPADRDAYVERSVHVFRTIGSPGFPFDEERVRRLALRSWERGISPDGPARQLLAVIASGSRHERSAALRMPTARLPRGRRPAHAGRARARHRRMHPGRRALVIEGMGHDLPRPVWPRLVDAITRLTSRS